MSLNLIFFFLVLFLITLNPSLISRSRFMKLLDSLTVQSSVGEHRIELYMGDLSDMPVEHAVDVLVASSFPNQYRPTKGSLIGALQRRGISVRELADDKAVDMREFASCWLSKPIDTPEYSGIQFKQLLCFEPKERGKANEVVGDIFRALLPFVFGPPNIRSVAVPLVATGKQGTPTADILDALIDNAVNWLSRGTPIDVIKVVEYDPFKAGEMKGAFGFLKRRYRKAANTPLEPGVDGFQYDVFISYSRKNQAEADWLYDELQRQRPDLKIFIDRVSMRAGTSWQQKLYKALDDSRRVMVLLSPDYIASKICQEELNIAISRNRDSEGVLMPLYLYHAQLPTYIKLLNYIDCREGDHAKLAIALGKLGI
jgi:hypothetical protein